MASCSRTRPACGIRKATAATRCIALPCWWGELAVRTAQRRRTLGLFPSPLRGGVRGGGHAFGDIAAEQTPTPLPDPPPQGGRERESVASLTWLIAAFAIVTGATAALAQTTFTP